MRVLYLLRHGVTEANEQYLYYGSTDLPLSPAGRAQATALRDARLLPDCERRATSGMLRTDETLLILTGRRPDAVFADLREMSFGAFEMRGYEELKDIPAYRRWAEDTMRSGNVRCPGGESPREFSGRVRRGGAALLAESWRSMLVVVHGGVIANLMAEWFPREQRGFYQWQPGPCGGYRVTFEGGKPLGFSSIQEEAKQ
ncbi:MAG: histidine phosphatase family protein [Clostridia bacterium]|nr:histidine phosphatase family protein [Clostridia bacterium]